MRRILEPLTEFGLVAGLIYLIDRASERLFSRRILYYYSIVAQPVAPPRLRPGKDMRTVVCTNPEEVAPFADQMTASEQMNLERFGLGYTCVVLAKADELLAYGWIAYEDFREDEVRCIFSPLPTEMTGWDFDVYILPQHRGTLTFARVWDAINGALSASGRTWTVSRISRFNISSYQSHKSLGAVTCFNMLFVVVGRVQLMISPRRPFIHLSLSADSFAQQRIDVAKNVDLEPN